MNNIYTIYEIATGKIIKTTSSPEAPDVSQEYGILPGQIEGRDYYVEEGNIVPFPEQPDHADWNWETKQWVQNITAAKIARVLEISQKYSKICQGTYLAKDIYVDCTVGETTYRMNAGRMAAETHDGGIRLAEQSGEETTFVVDYNNEVHYGVPIAQAKQIALQQAQDARNYYVQYQMFKQQIAGATTVEQLRDISLDFTVNV